MKARLLWGFLLISLLMLTACQTFTDEVGLEPTAKGNATVQSFAHQQHSADGVDTYERAAMGVPNPQGNKVMWASDWGNDNGPIYAYVAQMPNQ